MSLSNPHPLLDTLLTPPLNMKFNITTIFLILVTIAIF